MSISQSGNNSIVAPKSKGQDPVTLSFNRVSTISCPSTSSYPIRSVVYINPISTYPSSPHHMPVPVPVPVPIPISPTAGDVDIHKHGHLFTSNTKIHRISRWVASTDRYPLADASKPAPPPRPSSRASSLASSAIFPEHSPSVRDEAESRHEERTRSRDLGITSSGRSPSDSIGHEYSSGPLMTSVYATGPGYTHPHQLHQANPYAYVQYPQYSQPQAQVQAVYPAQVPGQAQFPASAQQYQNQYPSQYQAYPVSTQPQSQLMSHSHRSRSRYSRSPSPSPSRYTSGRTRGRSYSPSPSRRSRSRRHVTPPKETHIPIEQSRSAPTGPIPMPRDYVPVSAGGMGASGSGGRGRSMSRSRHGVSGYETTTSHHHSSGLPDLSRSMHHSRTPITSTGTGTGTSTGFHHSNHGSHHISDFRDRYRPTSSHPPPAPSSASRPMYNRRRSRSLDLGPVGYPPPAPSSNSRPMYNRRRSRSLDLGPQATTSWAHGDRDRALQGYVHSAGAGSGTYRSGSTNSHSSSYHTVHASPTSPTIVRPSQTHPLMVPIDNGRGGWVVVPAPGHKVKVMGKDKRTFVHSVKEHNKEWAKREKEMEKEREKREKEREKYEREREKERERREKEREKRAREPQSFFGRLGFGRRSKSRTSAREVRREHEYGRNEPVITMGNPPRRSRRGSY